jgi:chemotaxis methyl-accepting protein methylase
MTVHQIKDPAEYAHYLQENPHEIDRLFAELLIGVTAFFRDPQAFDVLAEKALPELLAARAEGHEFRVWVPGCASGEEAYSDAILLHECMEKLKRRFHVQVFGTDLDAHAIEAARDGIYPAGITADVSKERLQRYFSHHGDTYHIRKEIRETLVFAPQNVIKDPPFTKLDLVVCRNLLIYLDAELQRRLFPIFHYALRPGGLLFLGPSESTASGRSSAARRCPLRRLRCCYCLPGRRKRCRRERCRQRRPRMANGRRRSRTWSGCFCRGLRRPAWWSTSAGRSFTSMGGQGLIWSRARGNPASTSWRWPGTAWPAPWRRQCARPRPSGARSFA